MSQLKRQIKEEEKIFIQGLLSMAGVNFTIPEMVIQLNDGGKGSLQFTDKLISEFNEIIDATYIDSDNIPVLISLRASGNNLTEIDFWKIDYSELKSYPTLDKIQIIKA